MQLNKLFFQYAILPIPLLKDRTINFSASHMLIVQAVGQCSSE